MSDLLSDRRISQTLDEYNPMSHSLSSVCCAKNSKRKSSASHIKLAVFSLCVKMLLEA